MAAAGALGLLVLAALGLKTVLGNGAGGPDALPWTPAPAQVAERGWAILEASRPGAAAESLLLAETSLGRHGASCEALALGSAAWAETAAAGEAPIVEGFERARAMADAALALDPRCHRALLGRGLARWLGEWDWSGAEADLQQLLAATPRDAAARAAYAELLLFGGREAAARDEIARALGHAPDSIEARLTAALISWMMDRPGEARAHYLQVLRQDPGHPDARTSLAKLARGPVERAASFSDGVPLQRLEEMAGKRRLRPGHVAVFYAEAGRSEEALEWLERAVAEHDPTVLFYRFDRRWDPLREHPRYRRAMASLGLPAAEAAS